MDGVWRSLRLLPVDDPTLDPRVDPPVHHPAPGSALDHALSDDPGPYAVSGMDTDPSVVVEPIPLASSTNDTTPGAVVAPIPKPPPQPPAHRPRTHLQYGIRQPRICINGTITLGMICSIGEPASICEGLQDPK